MPDNVVDTLRVRVEEAAGNNTKEIDSLVSSLTKLKDTLAPLQTMKLHSFFTPAAVENAKGFSAAINSIDTAKLKDLAALDLSKLGNAMSGFNMDDMRKGFQFLGDQMGNMWNNFSKFLSTQAQAPAVVSKATTAIRQQTKAAHSHHKSFSLASTALGKFFNSIKRIAFYRLIRGAIKSVTQGFSEGIENMYFWSQAVGTSFAPAMDRLATATLYLKNGFASMWSPLIERAIPIIDHVIDKLVDFFNFAQEGFARLTGAATWTKALKYPVQFAENTEGATKAAKALQNVLMGFDELNVINTPKDSGRGAAGDEKDYSAMFKVMETTGLNDGKNWGQRLAELINNFINGVDWHAKGEELSQKVNNFLKPLNDFLTETNWQGIGDAIGDFIDGAIEGIDATLIGETLLNTFKAAVGVLIGLISSFAENETGKDLGQKITDFIETVCIGLAEWIQSTDFVQILTNITKIVGDIIEGLDIGRILEAVGVLAENLAKQIPGIVMHSLTESALLPLTASLRAIGLGEAADWIDENITGSVDKVTEAFKQAADVATQAGKDAKESAKRQKELRNALVDEKKELIGTLQDLQYSKDLIPTEEFDRRFGLIKEILKGTKVDIQSLPPELRSLATQAQNSFEVLGDGSASFAEGFVDDWDSVDTALANAEGAYGAAYWSIDGYIKAFVKSAAKGAKELGESWKNSTKTIESAVATFGNTLNAWRLYDQAYRKGLELTKGLKDSMRYFSLNIPATISVTNTTSTAKVHGATFDMSLMGFASGGFTPKAELFYAGENGIPEIMGKVNGRSAVVGGDEITGIADAIYAQGEREEQLLSTLIAVVQAKDFSFTPNAASGRLINQALRQYSGVTG